MSALRQRISELSARLARTAAKADRALWFMEVCGTHTVSACRAGLHSLLPENVRMISGPGCPVCVTAQRYIDALLTIGRLPNTVLVTYGDMIRVPGSLGSLEAARSEGADVRVVTSTMDAVAIAAQTADREVAFAAVGFETTAPATAAAILKADRLGLDNFTVLSAHKLVVPAMAMLLEDKDSRIEGFLCPGHVSVIIGADAFRPLVDRYRKPCVIAGFQPLQMLEGIVHLAEQVCSGSARLENLYPQAVRSAGNVQAQRMIDEVFEVGGSAWRMLGELPASGLQLRPRYARFDALQRFGVALGADHEPPGCRCGEVITGKCLPDECRLFERVCTPTYPIGPCMVSSEGSCQAWFKYRRGERVREKLQEAAV